MAVLRIVLLLAVLAACWPVPRTMAFTAFSRQTGGACTLCHFQDMHSLNAYGREFLKNSFHETPEMLRQRRQMQNQPSQATGEPAAHLAGRAEKGASLPANAARAKPSSDRQPAEQGKPVR